MSGSGSDPYVVLGVPRDADSAAIRKAYQALALQLHPDKRTGADTAEPPVTGAARVERRRRSRATDSVWLPPCRRRGPGAGATVPRGRLLQMRARVEHMMVLGLLVVLQSDIIQSHMYTY